MCVCLYGDNLIILEDCSGTFDNCTFKQFKLYINLYFIFFTQFKSV